MALNSSLNIDRTHKMSGFHKGLFKNVFNKPFGYEKTLFTGLTSIIKTYKPGILLRLRNNNNELMEEGNVGTFLNQPGTEYIENNNNIEKVTTKIIRERVIEKTPEQYITNNKKNINLKKIENIQNKNETIQTTTKATFPMSQNKINETTYHITHKNENVSQIVKKIINQKNINVNQSSNNVFQKSKDITQQTNVTYPMLEMIQNNKILNHIKINEPMITIKNNGRDSIHAVRNNMKQNTIKQYINKIKTKSIPNDINQTNIIFPNIQKNINHQTKATLPILQSLNIDEINKNIIHNNSNMNINQNEKPYRVMPRYGQNIQNEIIHKTQTMKATLPMSKEHQQTQSEIFSMSKYENTHQINMNNNNNFHQNYVQNMQNKPVVDIQAISQEVFKLFEQKLELEKDRLGV